jgi:hypothetical protein
MASSKHPSSAPSTVVSPSSSSSAVAGDEEAEWRELELREAPKTWKDHIWVPIGLMGGALALGAGLVVKGRGDGRALGQRIMEARVAAQATLLLGLVTVGYAFSKQAEGKKRGQQE